jgi:cellulose synthase/poly-beta-1,6-N-acetylglucosamine synthase-like glycosyltransferase
MSAFLHVLAWLLGTVSALLGIAVAVFAFQILLSTLPRRRSPPPATPAGDDARARVVVLLPAHNEAAGIARTLQTVLPQLCPGDRMLVVADNCSDDTAAIARDAGAEVVERFDEMRRGKGFALAFGVDAMRAAPPDLVVILDADCDLGVGALGALSATVAATGRPAQALYLMTAAAGASLPRRLAEFAWRVRNLARPAGWHRIGLPCQLMGTGMAFSWDMLEHAPLANASIVEDMKLGIDLAATGRSPVFCRNALVTSTFPETARASVTQRTRWEHGHLEMILRELPGMLWTGVRRFDLRLIGLALDLFVPPLALLAAFLLLAFGCAAALALVSHPGALLGADAGLLVLFAIAAIAAWAVHGRDLVRARELLAIPMYIGRKFPIYANFLLRRQKQWVRTDRDEP